MIYGLRSRQKAGNGSARWNNRLISSLSRFDHYLEIASGLRLVLPVLVLNRRPRGFPLTWILLHRHRIEEKFSTAPLALSEQQNSHLIRSEMQGAVSTITSENAHSLVGSSFVDALTSNIKLRDTLNDAVSIF